MNRIVKHALAAASAAFVWSSSARAEEVPPPPSPPPPPLMVAPRPPREVITWQETMPNSGLLTSGALMFGIAYGSSVIAAAASDRPGDSALAIPLAGPWIDLANREDCQSVGCASNEAANRVLLVSSGLFQAAGMFQMVSAFLFPETRTVTRAATGVHVTPTAGRGSVGISAYGTF